MAETPDPDAQPTRLTEAQADAAAILRGMVEPRRFQAALLKGPMRIEYREPPELGGKVIASTPASFR